MKSRTILCIPPSASTNGPTNSQLLNHMRPPLPVEPGCPARVDYEYKRNGTCNLFAFFEPHRGWRHIRLTQQRTKLDVAECLRELVEQLYPHA